MVRGKHRQQLRQAQRAEAVAAAPGGRGVRVVVEQAVRLLQAGRRGRHQADGRGEAPRVAGADRRDGAQVEVVAPAGGVLGHARRGLGRRPRHALRGQPGRGLAVPAGQSGQRAEDHRPRQRRERDPLAEERPAAGEPGADLLQHPLAQRVVPVDVRDAQGVRPGQRGDVADAGRAGVAPGRQPRDVERIAGRPAAQGVPQRRPPVRGAGQRLAHDGRAVRGPGGHEQRGGRTEAGGVRRVRERRGQRARGCPLGGGAVPGANAPLVPGAHLDDEVGRLVGDPAPDVAALRPLGVVEEAVERRERGRRPGRVRVRQGQRKRAHPPARPLRFRGLRLEPADRVEDDAGGAGPAVEAADQHEPAFGVCAVEGRPVLQRQQRLVVPRRAGRADRPRRAAERGDGFERRRQGRRVRGRRLGAGVRAGEDERRRDTDRRAHRHPPASQNMQPGPEPAPVGNPPTTSRVSRSMTATRSSPRRAA